MRNVIYGFSALMVLIFTGCTDDGNERAKKSDNVIVSEGLSAETHTQKEAEVIGLISSTDGSNETEHMHNHDKVENTVALEYNIDPSTKSKQDRSNLNPSFKKVLKKEPTCDVKAFVTTGSKLLAQIRKQEIECINPLFSKASEAIREGTFLAANIITVANEAKKEGVKYDGVDADEYLSKLHYWIRAYFYQGDRKLLKPVSQAATKKAIDALVNNSHFFDKTEANAKVLNLALGANLNNAKLGKEYVSLVNDLLDTFDKSYNDVPKWGSTFATVFWHVMSQCARDTECRVNEFDKELVAKVGNFMYDNLDWLATEDSDYHLHNLGSRLGNFYSAKNDKNFKLIKKELEFQLHRVFDEFGPDRNTTTRRAYLQALASVNDNDVCSEYQLCDKKQEIIDSVLTDRISCPSGTLFMWAQDMNTEQLEWACSALIEDEKHFHKTMQTNNDAVVPDDNEKLRMVIFNSSREWKVYGYALFGASTNNGGLYLEGDPSASGDQATFFAYEDVKERPVFDIWNLHHEYIHYLDGRFIKKGDFILMNDIGHSTWYTEGIAEYISKRNCNDRAIVDARAGTHVLSTVFKNEYGVGQSLIYQWGYLATRFMFEKHETEFFDMLDEFKEGKYKNYRKTMVDPWIKKKTFDAEFSKWLKTVKSEGCTVDATRPVSPVEPIDIATVQGTDQVGIDVCDRGDKPLGKSTKIRAGVAVCLADKLEGDEIEISLSVPSGLVNVSLEITLRHGNGNPDLYYRYDSRPYHNRKYDQKSNNPDADETILVKSVQQGWNYVNVYAEGDFSGATLLARYIQNDQNTSTENEQNTTIENEQNTSTENEQNTTIENEQNTSTQVVLIPISPLTGATVNPGTTSFEWEKLEREIASNVTKWNYTVLVLDADTNKRIYFNGVSPDANCDSNGCRYELDLPSGNYKWQIGVYESYDNGKNAYLLQSEYINFTVSNSTSNRSLTPISPLTGVTVDPGKTSFEWKKLEREIASNVTKWHYTVKVLDADTDKRVYFNGVSEDANCDSTACLYPLDLPNGNYKWQLGVYELYDNGEYAYLLETDYIKFTVAK